MRRILTLAVTSVLMSALIIAPAWAQTEGEVTTVHGIPDTPADIYVDGEQAAANVNFGDVTSPAAIPAGEHEVAVAPAGEPVANAVLSGTVTTGESTTIAAHLAENGDPTVSTFQNDVSQIAAGECRVVAHHTGKAPTVDVFADGAVLFEGLSNGETGKASVSAATYAVAVAPAGAGADAAVLEGNVTCTEGAAVLLYAIGDADAGTLALASQSVTGLGSAPGGVPSGEGPLPSGGTPIAVAILALLGIVAVGAGIPALRRSR